MRALFEKLRWLRETAGPLWWYTGMIFISSRVGDVLNLYTSMFLLPHLITSEELGAVDPLMRLAGFASIPLGVLSLVGAKYLSTYHATGQAGKIRRVIRDMAFLSVVSAGIFLIVLLRFYPAISVRVRVDSPYLLEGLCLFTLVSSITPLLGVMLQGTQRFATSAAAGLIDPVLRLAVAALLIPVYRVTGYLLAYVVAGVGALLVSSWGLRRYVGPGTRSEPYYAEWRGLLAYAWPAAIGVASGAWLSFLEPFAIRNFLPAQDSAGYYMAMRFGSIPMFLVGALLFVVFPLFSHRHERGEDTQGMLRQTFVVTATLSLAGAGALAALARWLLGLRADWVVYQDYAPHLGLVAAAVLLQSLASLYTTHEMACRRFGFLWVQVPLIVVESVVLYVSFGWSALQPYLPGGLWTAIDAALPRTLAYAIEVMLVARGLLLAGLMIQWRRQLARARDQKSEVRDQRSDLRVPPSSIQHPASETRS